MAIHSVPAPRAGGEPQWQRLIGEVLLEPHRIAMQFQPIVSLTEACVVGYEALSRFEPSEEALPAGARMPSPDQWFAAADQLGLGAELESRVIRHCLLRRYELPPNCFLTVNVSPHLVTDPLISEPLLDAGPLAPLVLELTEHQSVADLAPLVRLRDQISERGGLVALDDAGSGWSGLQQITRVRPHMIKLDRALVAGMDTDETKLALTELLGEFAARTDAWLLAEGVETWPELDACMRLGVPLAQGYLLGRPGPAWQQLDPGVEAALRQQRRRAGLTEHVARLIENVDVVNYGTAPVPGMALEADDNGRPIAVLVPGLDNAPGHLRRPISLRVPPSASVVETARRMLARDPRYRFDPVVCIDEVGLPVGIIRPERLIHELLTPHPERWSADGYLSSQREGVQR